MIPNSKLFLAGALLGITLIAAFFGPQALQIVRGAVSGVITISGRIAGVSTPVDNNDAATKAYVAAQSGGNVNIQEFTSSGTWTVPSGWTTAYIEAYVQGAGGGGGGVDTSNLVAGGSGGGSGELIIWRGTVTGNKTVTIGTGGAGGASCVSCGLGTIGGDSVFGSVTALGGNPGGFAFNAANRLHTGVSVTNQADKINAFGIIGLATGVSLPGLFPAGVNGQDNGYHSGGGGAASYFGAGAKGSDGNTANQQAGGIGAGGGGAGSNGQGTGGSGGNGYVIVIATKLN